MRTVLWVVALGFAGCPGSQGTPGPQPPAAAADTALRIRIAQAEARRGEGLAELEAIARGDRSAERVLALRGLGRIGGPRALPIVTAALADPDPAIVAAAASAIGVAMSLDEELAGTPAISRALVDALAKAEVPTALAVIEALGRAGDASTQAVLIAHLPRMPAAAAAVAIALARHGRRTLALSAAARATVNGLTTHADAAVRYAAAHALAREQLPSQAEPAEVAKQAAAANALAKLLGDPDPLVRAQAAQALARRKAVVAHRDALSRTLNDADWRVAVEAMRALAGEASDRTGRRLAAVALVAWLWALDGVSSGEPYRLALREAAQLGRDEQAELLGTLEGVALAAPGAPAVHVVLEGLRTLAPRVGSEDPLLASLVRLVRDRAEASSRIVEPARSWIACLATATGVRADPKADYAAMTRCKLPAHLKLPLIGELIGAKVGTLEQRRAALAPLLAHGDARVRVAGMSALVSLWSEGNPADHRAVVAMIVAALGVPDGLVAGTAVELAETLYPQVDEAREREMREALDAALIARAQTEKDPELAAALFGLLGKRKLAGAASGCRAGLAGAPVLAKAAAACLKALGSPVDPPPIGAATAPPVELAKVLGTPVRWKLETTRGPIAIELRPDVAPWAVATIATLTDRGFYDGLEFHRVVPNFVAQGGDPTQSGWGGPGFTIPAEPSSGAGYVQGGVGMADAGRDSAGSQWFVMHAPAPHLDGRYTWFGSVVEGQNAADSLVIGDKVIRATIDRSPRP